MMIDWFRGAIPFVHQPIPRGRVISIQPDGSIDWVCAKRHQVRSSWETNINIQSVTDDLEGGLPYSNLFGQEISLFEAKVKVLDGLPVYFQTGERLTRRLLNDLLFNLDDEELNTLKFYQPVLEFTPYEGNATTLYIDGNLSKFLQGHNIFGSTDLNRLLYLTFEKIVTLLPDFFKGHDLQIQRAKNNILAGEYKVKMLDINELYDCGNDASVEAWLHAAEIRAHSRHGRAKRDKGTVYLGKESKRWAFKFYNKAREMNATKKHRLPNDLQGLGLESFAQGKLRAELRIFSKQLEEHHGITHGKHINEAILRQLFNEYIGRINMTAQSTLIDEQLMKLPRTAQSTYQLWRQGASLKDMLPHNTFYRHRRILLEYQIDILVPCPAPEHNNVVPMLRIIEAVPVSIPQWAYEKGLVAA